MKDTLKFSVYEHSLVYNGDQLLKRKFIVLKEQNEIVAWTDFHKYIRTNKSSRVKSITTDGGMRHYNVAQLLNYAFFGKYHIEKLNDLTIEVVKSFLNDYGLGRLPEDTEDIHRNKNTVNLCVMAIMDFLEEYNRHNKESKFTIEDLYRKEEVFSKGKRKYITKKVPVFDVLYNEHPKPIFRDMPESAFKVIMNNVIEKHTGILMLVALSAFAGLRPAEGCNVRRADSALGPGLRFEIVNGEIVDIFIDLTKELNLRSDLVNVGSIKKERTQRVYRAFLSVFNECYKIYMKYIEGQKYEKQYGPLTVGRNGMAYTYDAYYREFQKVIKACIPEMLKSDDPELVNYGQLLLEHNISPHIFRHWFSVKLTLFGEDVAGLMYWRGDKNPTSALTYITNKSDLIKQYEKVSDSIFDYSLWRAGKQHND